jgi:hypothetical protein
MTKTLMTLLAATVVVLGACSDEKESPDYKLGESILAPGGPFEWGHNGGVPPTSDDCVAALDMVLIAMPSDAPEDEEAFLEGCNDYIEDAY